MSVSYRPLLHLLIERGMTRQDLKKLGISSATISKLSKNEYIALSVIDRICQALKCEISDVVLIVHEDFCAETHTETSES
jgi:DNA-binding Xre family transcriptional regulator